MQELHRTTQRKGFNMYIHYIFESKQLYRKDNNYEATNNHPLANQDMIVFGDSRIKNFKPTNQKSNTFKPNSENDCQIGGTRLFLHRIRLNLQLKIREINSRKRDGSWIYDPEINSRNREINT